MTPEQKDVIDNASYEELFEIWKHMVYFEENIEADVEEYFTKIMSQRCDEFED